MSEVKLLPCPFCGSDKVGFWDTEDEEHPYQIVCLGCFNGTDECITKDVAIKKWNTRKPMERIIERLEEKKRSDGTESDREWGKYIGYVDSIKIVKEEGGIE